MSFRPILPKPDIGTMLGTTASGVILSPQLAEDMKFQVQKLEFVESTFDNSVTVEHSDPMSLSPSSGNEVILSDET